ncbi:Uncharacterised protein [Legionella steigerwaltii]|uniref:Uncharacterized protein n=1 Tax=Legionella steigerwaltii TaxID=460 RepID=A0A378L8F2_9GAMM|nr:hypothetical protein [Legionella steigerwaltii]KTD77694.1 hypothetical protein Lstg_2051 [Legionella steigerwaltii]STY23004.1 Uncharacterised protein [Legionella steigerwaltii]
MEKVSIRSYKTISHLLLPFIIFIGFFYSSLVKADTLPAQPPGQQLAYFIGFHSGGYYEPPPYYFHRHHRNLFWTPWRYVGHGCRKSCLIDRWSGQVLRCRRICR